MKIKSSIHGCELCGDFPVIITGRCHPCSPVRIEMEDSKTMAIYCFIPDCNRLIAKFEVRGRLNEE